MSKELRLVFPCEKYIKSYIEAYEEDKHYRPDAEMQFGDPTDIIQKAIDYREGNNLKPGYVSSTSFWLIDNEEFIGTIDIRHTLTPNLMKLGGNIGYQIRCSKWGQGYGSKQLALALPYAKEVLGLDRVLITCNDDNYGSAAVIENNGGILEDKVQNEGRESLTRRYWITIKQVTAMDYKTNVMRLLDKAKINYKHYTYANTTAISGIEVAKVLNLDPNHVFKTLVTIGATNNHYVFVVPVEKELDLKKAAKCVNEKSISMVKSKDLLALTGYVHGGCSPIGMKKFFVTTIDSSILQYSTIVFSAGKIGYQVELTIDDLKKIIKLDLEDICC